MQASTLYAMTQNRSYVPQGNRRCHWCGEPCGETWAHDEPAKPMFTKRRGTAKHPDEHWICQGCMLFRRRRCTVFYNEGRFKDGQEIAANSWMITEHQASAMERSIPGEPFLFGMQMLSVLLRPPTLFCLMLLDDGAGVKNEIHRAVVNVHDVIKGGTELGFTLNNEAMSYTPYELEMAMKSAKNHCGPGAAALMRLFGAPIIEEADEPDPEKRERGRPPKENWDGSAGGITKTVS